MDQIKEYKDIIVTEYIGREGAERLAAMERDRIGSYFPPGFLTDRDGGTFLREPDLRTPHEKFETIQSAALLTDGRAYIHPVGCGGIFTVLWDMAETLQCGMEVTIRDIPVRQETVELCEFLRLNPYYLMSGEEVVLIVTGSGSCLIRRLKENRIHAASVGFITGGRDKILYQGDSIRYLDRPAEDEFLRFNRRRIS